MSHQLINYNVVNPLSFFFSNFQVERLLEVFVLLLEF